MPFALFLARTVLQSVISAGGVLVESVGEGDGEIYKKSNNKKKNHCVDN